MRGSETEDGILPVKSVRPQRNHQPGESTMEWIFVMWVTVNSGSLSQSRMTEAQCRAAVAEVDGMADPLMAFCIGPGGERVRTSNVGDRMRRLLPQPSAPPAPPAAANPHQQSSRGGLGL